MNAGDFQAPLAYIASIAIGGISFAVHSKQPSKHWESPKHKESPARGPLGRISQW